MATSTVENYLKAILHLDEESTAGVSVGAIAAALSVTPGTVSSMMKHLAEQDLISYVPRRSVDLLPKGRTQALRVIRRHRLIETFLVEVMEFDWAEVHEEAEVLEHVISDRLLTRIDEMLGYPRHDPHGHPIPDEKGVYDNDRESKPLSEIGTGGFRLVRVDDSDNELLDWLQDHQLRPGGEYRLKKKDLVAGIIEIQKLDGGPVIRMSEKTGQRIIAESI